MNVKELTNYLIGKVDFDKTNSFSKAFLDYIDQKPELDSFYEQYPTTEGLKIQAEKRNFSSATRKVTSSVLSEQYKGIDASELTIQNIENLNSANTFTITTGHQLNIFTGPLYFIYKIITAINACKAMKKQYPEFNFVPVYWMASEDHDFEEIDHFQFNGKKFTWETDQTGAVGRFNPKSIKPIFDQIKMPDFFKEAYLKHDTLAAAGRHYVNALFGSEGLVVIDADDAQLKKVFQPVIEADIFKNTPNQLVNQTNQELSNKGYTAQVFPREINFFYLKEDLRSRIVKDSDEYAVLDTDIKFTKEALQIEIDNHPERFSPNVVLRPLYQETILPNLAYVGGPSELVYWFQLKGVFDNFNTAFPALLPRNFAGVITPNVLQKIEKASFSFEEIFIDEDQLIKEKVKLNSTHNLDLKSEIENLKSAFESAKAQSIKIDATLEKHVAAEQQKAENSIRNIEKKMLRTEKRNHETLIERIHVIKLALFPNGTPQERKDNFLNFYLADPDFVINCLESLDPFDLRFHLISATN
jgi:bacillithiol biosynthesis cysteine-adding enzyme BshC